LEEVVEFDEQAVARTATAIAPESPASMRRRRGCRSVRFMATSIGIVGI
jgi:hypothetical protein